MESGRLSLRQDTGDKHISAQRFGAAHRESAAAKAPCLQGQTGEEANHSVCSFIGYVQPNQVGIMVTPSPLM